MIKLESITILKNNYGYIATIRFNESHKDKIISSNNHGILDRLIDKHVYGVLNGTI